MTAAEAGYFWVAQFAGGIAGAAVLALLTSGFGDMTDQTGALGANDYGATISLGGAFVLEVLLTFTFVTVILLVTGKSASPGFAGLAIGLSLTAVHLIGIPLTGTSVNPARSLGPALFAGGEPLAHVWLFILAPLVGAALAFLAVRFLSISVPLAPTGGAAAGVDETGVQVPTDQSPVPPARTPSGTDSRGKRRSRT
jgi:aquaporin Z